MADRFFDILFSGLALLVLSPLLLPIALILKFSGEGEIFFLQDRVGKDGQVFKLFKFATMLKDSPLIGTRTITIKDDPRVLPFGKFLRKSKINELPQLLNILRGDMSIIGPRPLTKNNYSAYSDLSQRIISNVRPGLSGIGSIAFRGEEELMQEAETSESFYSEIIAPYKGSLEEWFVQNKSLKIYFFSIFITLWVVIVPKSNILWKSFKTLPAPPPQLENALNYRPK
tara:strand:+ start:239 stop:922 length:684 start_codon:yes stop_codon:yes gene_type:complete